LTKTLAYDGQWMKIVRRWCGRADASPKNEYAISNYAAFLKKWFSGKALDSSR